MSLTNKPQTIHDLKNSESRVLTVKEEVRSNLIKRMQAGDNTFKGIVGYRDSVIPQIENAILSGQDVIFLGERGQGKSRLIRGLIDLLDEEIPSISGCEINDNPYDPVCSPCREKLGTLGDKTEITWLPKSQRYSEKLATPDISMADLIGDIDPIKVAEGHYLSDDFTVHYGLIPRSNRGLFAINELPDLSERIQVGLFNLMEERDIQIKGYKVRLPLDVYIVASANPEDYTNRGRIVTPLKDRFGAQIRTHYPKTLEDEILIIEQEKATLPNINNEITMPKFMLELVAEITNIARKSPDINQRSGVSVRMSIANYETLMSCAIRRAILLEEDTGAPRISDLPNILSSSSGKIELETFEDTKEARIIDELTKKATANTFSRYLNPQNFESLVKKFDQGLSIEVGPEITSGNYLEKIAIDDELASGLDSLDARKNPATMSSALEFILEGLHLSRLINRENIKGQYRYKA